MKHILKPTNPQHHSTHQALARRFALLAALAATLLATAPAHAQAQATSAAHAVSQRPDGPQESRLDELEFQENTLGEVVEVLRKRFPDVNFVAGGDLSGRRLSLKLRNVTLAEVLKAMEWACGGDVAFQRDGRMVAVLTRPSSQAISRACSLAAYLGETPRTDAEAVEREKKLRQLEEALAEYEEMRASARGTASRSAPKLTFRVHQGTRLLLLTGPKEDVESVEQLVKQLEEGVRASRSGGRHDLITLDPTPGSVPGPASSKTQPNP